MYEEHSWNWQGKPNAGKESQDVRHVATIVACDSVQGAVELKSVSVLGAFAEMRKTSVSFVMSVCPSVLIEQLGPHLTNFRDLWHLGVFRKFVEKIQVSSKSGKNTGYSTRIPIHTYVISRLFLLGMTNVSDKSKSKHTFYIQQPFPPRKSCRLWDNVEKYSTAGESTDDHGACAFHAGYLRLQTHTHSEYVTLIVCLLQQCLHERNSVLPST
jgi:hypothetical protein